MTPPITLALAPSATNTVEKPSTNRHGRDHGIAPDQRLRLAVGQPLQRSAGEIDEIGRHQRQHAGRQEADQAGEQGGEDGDVGGHGS